MLHRLLLLLQLLLLPLALTDVLTGSEGIQAVHLSQFAQESLPEMGVLLRNEDLMGSSSSPSAAVSLSRKKRYLALPVGSNIEVKWSMNFPFNTFTLYEAATTLAIPIKIPIPDSLVLDEERVKRSLSQYSGHNRAKLDSVRKAEDRREKAYLYNYLQAAFEKSGMAGRSCVLRAICEVAEAPFDQGLLGELVNTMLTPSLAGKPTKEESWLGFTDYLAAEAHGTVVGECGDQYGNCTVSPFHVLHEAVHMMAQ